MMKHLLYSTGLLLCLTTGSIRADDGRLPVREITVFKDGHALVHHRGDVPTDENGNAIIDYVPTPVIGTFRAHCGNDQATLKSVASGRHKITKTRTAQQAGELLRANVGARVFVRDRYASYAATIVTADADSPLVFLKTDQGTRAVPVESIQELTFVEDPKRDVEYTDHRNQLRLQLDWGNHKPAATADVGMSYLQQGIRWIPGYRLQLNDNGKVRVTLQATLLNEMTDLNNVTVNLLVGVPSFEFKGTIDPIALNQTVEQLSVYFAQPGVDGTSNGFSNSIMLSNQISRMGEHRPTRTAAPPPGGDPGPDIAGTGANEDLFVYTVNNITLANGERMIVRVGEWEMNYEDVYRLEIPARPPQEIRQHFDSTQQQRLAELYHAPKVKHIIRIENTSNVPFTTAPALIASSNSVLGQGMMTFTSPGSRVDIPLTTAVNVAVTHQEDESGRREEKKESGHIYFRVDYEGSIRLTNYQNKPINVEVVRGTLGAMDSAGADGMVSSPSAWSDHNHVRPEWWNWYSWPAWWYHWNARGLAEWNVTIKSGADLVLPYKWHYFWRS